MRKPKQPESEEAEWAGGAESEEAERVRRPESEEAEWAGGE